MISEAGFKLLSVSQRSISEKAPPGGSASSCPTLPKLHRRVYGDGDGDGDGHETGVQADDDDDDC